MSVGSECVGHHIPNKKQVRWQLPSLGVVCVWGVGARGPKHGKALLNADTAGSPVEACLLPTHTCPSFLPSVLPSPHSWTLCTCPEWLSSSKLGSRYYLPRLLRCQRASGIVPTSATFSQHYLQYTQLIACVFIMGKSSSPSFPSLGWNILWPCISGLSRSMKWGECLILKVTKGGWESWGLKCGNEGRMRWRNKVSTWLVEIPNLGLCSWRFGKTQGGEGPCRQSLWLIFKAAQLPSLLE